MNINQVFDLDQLDKLLNAKIEFGQLFLFKYPDMYVVFRPLTVGESEAIGSLSEKLNATAVEDWIFQRTFIVSNRDESYFLKRAPFPLVSELANTVATLSNVQDEEDYKKKVMVNREKIHTVQNVVEKIIHGGYPQYTNKDVKGLTQFKQFELLAKAEAISGQELDLGQKAKNKDALRQATKGATVIGGEAPIDITSPHVADKPDFNEEF